MVRGDPRSYFTSNAEVLTGEVCAIKRGVESPAPGKLVGLVKHFIPSPGL